MSITQTITVTKNDDPTWNLDKFINFITANSNRYNQSKMFDLKFSKFAGKINQTITEGNGSVVVKLEFSDSATYKTYSLEAKKYNTMDDAFLAANNIKRTVTVTT
jgi:hypothetical protein